MKILFDHGTPAPLRHALRGHSVSTAHEMGWNDLDNGRLLAAAETAFDVLVTTDQNIRHQQNMSGRRLAILVLPTTSWPYLRSYEAQILAAIDALLPGTVVELKL